MFKWKQTTYPSTFIGLSDELAEVRSMLSAHVYNKDTEKPFGGQGSGSGVRFSDLHYHLYQSYAPDL